MCFQKTRLAEWSAVNSCTEVRRLENDTTVLRRNLKREILSIEHLRKQQM